MGWLDWTTAYLLSSVTCASFEHRGHWFSPCRRAAGAVLSLRTRALQTGSITQVALCMSTQVLSCRRRATVNDMTSHSLADKFCLMIFRERFFLTNFITAYFGCSMLCFYLFTSFVMFAHFFFFTWVTCTNYNQQLVVIVLISFQGPAHYPLASDICCTTTARSLFFSLLLSSLCLVFILRAKKFLQV